MSPRSDLLRLLAALLFFVALALPIHGIGHAFGHDDSDAPAEKAAACVECLSLGGAQPLPAAAPALPDVSCGAVVSAVRAPAFAGRPFRRPFQSRAPPSSLPASLG